MGLTYSRDGMARPLKILEDMLAEIREGVFFPDMTRSGRLVKMDKTVRDKGSEQASSQEIVKVESSDEDEEFNAWNLIPMQETSQLPSDVPCNSDHEINDACTETSSSDVTDDAADEPSFESRGIVFEPPKAPSGFTLWQHTKSRILHLSDHRFPHVFECGRRAGAFHTCQGVNPRWDTGICWRCFKSR